ncbi:MAG: hypothetical protein OXH78_10890 [Acidimicrobiaceae bacterium]|nr:hypothetical protein [Acidimicrobiaceae bacterium]
MNLSDDFALDTVPAAARRKLIDMSTSIGQRESITVDVNFPT